MIRSQKIKNYSVMSNIPLRDKRLSLKARGLIAFCLTLPDDWEYNIKGLANVIGVGKDAVASALKELEKTGYLEREQNRDKNGRLTTIDNKNYSTDIKFDINGNKKRLLKSEKP